MSQDIKSTAFSIWLIVMFFMDYLYLVLTTQVIYCISAKLSVRRVVGIIVS